MYQIVTVPRESPVVTVEQVCAFGRFDVPTEYDTSSPPVVTADYALIETFIDAATDTVEDMAAVACATETMLETYDFFPQQQDPRALLSYELSYAFVTPWWWFGSWPQESIELVRRPVQSVESVEYFDVNGALQTWDPSNYTVACDKICLNVGNTWPVTDRRQDCIQIAYVAGFESAVPSKLQLAVMFLAAHFWDNRSIVAVEKTSGVYMTLMALLQSFRSYRIPR
jgi:hypothetical protein